MTDHRDGRDTSGDARAIPQRRRSPAPTPPPGPSARGETRAVPVGGDRTQALPAGHDPYAGWQDDDDAPAAAPARGRDDRPTATRPVPTRAVQRPAVQQPPARPAAPPQGPPRRPDRTGPDRLSTPPRPPRRRHTVRRVFALVLITALVWAGASAWAVRSAWSNVDRVQAEPVGGHIAGTEGRNYLMVGSDGRTDLTPEQRNELGTGFVEGARTDSIMVLHTGGGEPTLLSIPRDSYVEIPGHGMNKINAAFNLGGPPLLAATIEQSTGLHLDGYVEIGFAGFAGLVDAVGGVRMCLPNAMQDEKAHIDLPAGCQVLDGKNALGYVRARYSDPEGDLGRVKRQRQFLGALMGKIATPSTAILPWKLHSVGGEAAGAVAIGTDDGMIETGRAFLGLRAVAGGEGNSVTVPISNPALQTGAGLAVEWDPTDSERLFAALREDDAVPSDLLSTGTK